MKQPIKHAHAVVIVGGGPTGMMLACELALAKVDVAIVERRHDQALSGIRARGLHARTLEMFDQRGLVERFLAEGKTAQVTAFVFNALDISAFPTRHNYGLALFQEKVERILAERALELGVTTYRERIATGFTQDDAGVTVTLEDGELRADYVVGCDGGRSVVRKQAGIEFPGWDPSSSWLIAEVKLNEEAPLGLRRDDKGFYGLNRHAGREGVVDVLIRDPEVIQAEATVEQLRAAVIAAYGSDFGLHDVASLSRFNDMTRQAAAYRAGRVLIAGDAAHVHGPAGGQGINTGLQDAVNLGWKLAQVVQGRSPDSLLDTYHAERHPVGARVMRTTMAATTLQRGDDRTMAVNEIITDLFKAEETRKRYAGMLSGLDIHYDLGAGHPCLGRRMPDLDITTSEGPRRVSSFLHDAKPLFLSFAGRFDISKWGRRVQHVEAKYSGAWELPVLGTVQAPTAVLVRPDGYVAWVGEGRDTGLEDALVKWFGAP